MNDRNTAGVSTGSVSILAIFVVLCLTTLATLSLVSARADYALSQKTMQSDVEYYAADAAAEEQLGELVGLLQSGGLAGVERDGRFTVARQDGAAVVQYTVPVNEIKSIFVEIEVGADGGGWTRKTWVTQVDDSGREEEPALNVLK